VAPVFMNECAVEERREVRGLFRASRGKRAIEARHGSAGARRALEVWGPFRGPL
jgi:hypothetical protein